MWECENNSGMLVIIHLKVILSVVLCGCKTFSRNVGVKYKLINVWKQKQTFRTKSTLHYLTSSTACHVTVQPKQVVVMLNADDVN